MSYNDPKTTRPGASRGSGRTIWIIAAAILALLLIAWALGLFGRSVDTATTTVGGTTTGEGGEPAAIVVEDEVAPTDATDPVVVEEENAPTVVDEVTVEPAPLDGVATDDAETDAAAPAVDVPEADAATGATAPTAPPAPPAD